MEMSSFRPDSHIAQQSRRDKLRIPSNPPPPSTAADHTPPQQPPPTMFLSFAGGLDLAVAAEAGGDGSFMPTSTSGIHDGANWIMNCAGGGGGGGGGGAPQTQTPMFPTHLYQESHLLFPSSQLYHSSFQEAAPPPSSTPCSWANELPPPLPLLPSYGVSANASVWMNRQSSQNWYGEGDLGRIKAAPTGGGATQSLSLSLSPNPLPELQVAQFEERFGQEDLAAPQLWASRGAADVAGFSSSPCPPKFAQGVMDSSAPEPRCAAGPFGPFTGYSAILKSSKFLMPGQLLLDEFCRMAAGSKSAKPCDASGKTSGSNGRRGNSGVSSSFYSSIEAGGEGCGLIHCPEFQHLKAKLLCMQEEVCKRYKQYHQQMQMVVSSFESVPGLSAATPYASSALKAVFKHFRSLKNAITDQLHHVSKLVGEQFVSSPRSSKDETTPRLKYIAQSTRKENAAAENNLNFLEHSQHLWRPQRGLPERAVSVLRAWLFDHFLHPYPTDTDKHMLAAQTGLSRNQVSNWFINARVRIWKPMVEEIHNLETNGTGGMDLNSSNRTDGRPVADDRVQPSSDQTSETQSNKMIDCSPSEPMLDEESHRRAMEQWHRDKRSRMEGCGIPAGMEGSLMSLAAYPVGMDIGGLGAVSLTLGLRHNESAQHQQHQMRHFGSHMVHDFVG